MKTLIDKLKALLEKVVTFFKELFAEKAEVPTPTPAPTVETKKQLEVSPPTPTIPTSFVYEASKETVEPAVEAPEVAPEAPKKKRGGRPKVAK